jgi:hypothetical protein
MADGRVYVSGTPEIYYSVRGGEKALEVYLPYARDNKEYLQYLRNPQRRTNVKFNSVTKRWSLPASQYALLRKELLMKHGQIEITVTGSTLEKCTHMCANADTESADECKCICMGVNHGSSASGYKEVADYLLVRATEFSQTVRLSLRH